MKRLCLVGGLALCLVGMGVGQANASAILNLPGFTTTSFPANDDGSVGPVNTGINMNFFGLNQATLFVNNNGNVTFTQPLGTFTPFAITGGSLAMLAPFFGDVMTAGGNPPSALVTYGNDTVGGHNAFGVDWINVGYFAGSPGPNRDSFQLIIIDRSDTGVGNFDFMFNYDQIQWETGQASGSDVNGCGGTSAHVGWTNGSGAFFEFAGSGVNGAFIDSGNCPGPHPGPNALINGRLNSDISGQYVFNVRNGQVVGQTPEPGSLVLLGTGLVLLARRLTRKSA